MRLIPVGSDVELVPSHSVRNFTQIDKIAKKCYIDLTMEKQKLDMDYTGLTAEGTPEFSFEDAEEYLEKARDAYRNGKAEFRGNRSEEQIDIAETASLEAEFFIDDYVHALGLKDHQEDTLGGIEDGIGLEQMKDAWRHLWIGMHMLTNRLERDHPGLGVKQLATFSPAEKMVIMQQLFNDFQEHNALRFGAIGNGDRRKQPKKEFGLEVLDDEGDRVMETIELDKERDAAAIGRRALAIGYETVGTRPTKKDSGPIIYMHTAGKVKPKDLKDLRHQFRPDYPDPVPFYAQANSAKDFKRTLENSGS